MIAVSAVQELAGMLLNSNYVIAFTGAGMSTESGIPDFRSKGEGLWEKIDPELLSVRTLRSNPKLFFRYYRLLDGSVQGKLPNQGHLALAELSRLGVVRAVVTQNIDGLHQRAGSPRVFEVHGGIQHCRCMRCNKEYPYALLHDALVQDQEAVPTSPCCGAVLRPGVVLFGDMMSPDFTRAQQEAFRADFALVLGTSLTVYPAAEIPLEVGRFAIINRDATPFDSQAVLAIRGSVGETLAALVAEVRIRKAQQQN